MRGYGGVSPNVLQQFATSEYSKLLNTGVYRNINTYDVNEGKGKGKGKGKVQPRTGHEGPEEE